MKKGRSTGQMLGTMSYASLSPNQWIHYYDHDQEDDPTARMRLFEEMAAKLELSYDFKCKNTTISVRFVLEK